MSDPCQHYARVELEGRTERSHRERCLYCGFEFEVSHMTWAEALGGPVAVDYEARTINGLPVMPPEVCAARGFPPGTWPTQWGDPDLDDE
jgi:hypothetical protein